MPMLAAAKSGPLSGRVKVPGDKSISHRALMFGALSIGETRITGLLEAADVLATARIVQALGAGVGSADGVWTMTGRGVGGLVSPSEPLDFGNSGTGARLMAGIVTGHPIEARFTGDASLSRRPMGRVLTPLRQMGLTVAEGDQDTLPLTLRGTADVIPIRYRLPVPSAQVKSAILLAGLSSAGETTVIEREATRDHTEKMLSYLGAEIAIEDGPEGRIITLKGQPHPEGPPDRGARRSEFGGVPRGGGSDLSRLRCRLAGCADQPDAHRLLRDGHRNGRGCRLREPPRAGRRAGGRHPHQAWRLARRQRAAGAGAVDDRRISGARSSRGLCGRRDADAGLAELRVKESDRLAATETALRACGVEAVAGKDSLTVIGNGRGAGRSDRHNAYGPPYRHGVPDARPWRAGTHRR